MSYIYVRNERIIINAYDLITSCAQIRKLITKYVEPIIQEYDLRPVELDILEFITREN